ncbi:hypothetical protein [Microbulbifer variabilis]|uniref:hypothetical protein n=1 Tax=Microbulbifer variabilis TaxID=266805 RepID=UPI001CFEB1E5|nr:hypothetical protein [Microbulbifer variabilis]
MHRAVITLMIFILPVASFSMDCPKFSINDYASESSTIFWGVPVEAKLISKDFEGKVLYRFDVMKKIKGKLDGVAQVYTENYELQKFQLGYEYIVFADVHGSVDLCGPSRIIQSDWNSEDFFDRADISEDTKLLVKKVFGVLEGSP